MPETSCPARAPALLAPWRRFCQWGVTLLLLLLPWLRSNGHSLLRIDIGELTLYFFGQVLRIEELYLVLLFSLVLTLGFLLMTMVLGRVWCGWLCPQTTLTDLAEWFAARLGMGGRRKRPAQVWRHLALHGGYLLLALLVAANLLWYFIEPQVFFPALLDGQLHDAAWIGLLAVAVTVYLDLALVKRLLCSDFCPYGRLQTALADQGTLTLHLPSAELPRCIACGACVRACPMGIDIRRGVQIECINCGRCLDACRQVMAKHGQPGLIRYTFGTAAAGLRTLCNPRTLLLGLATLALTVVFLTAVGQRPSASLKVSVSHTAASRILDDGNLATFFNAWVNNRGSTGASYRITARQAGNGRPLPLKGQTERLKMAGGENLRVDFVLVTPLPASRLDVEFILSDAHGAELAVTPAHIK